MSAAEALDAPRAVSEVKTASKFLFWAGVVLLCAWVLVPIYFLVINALSSPQQVTAFPKHWAPSFNFDSLQFFVTYGGVSLFVAFFVIAPMAEAMFRAADIPRRLMVAAIGLGTLTFTMSALPGTPALQNAIPMPFCGTTPFAAPGLVFIAAVIMLRYG